MFHYASKTIQPFNKKFFEQQMYLIRHKEYKEYENNQTAREVDVNVYKNGHIYLFVKSNFLVKTSQSLFLYKDTSNPTKYK